MAGFVVNELHQPIRRVDTESVALPFRFVPPPKGPWTFLRPRLLRVLAQRFDVRLLTVAAGAGIGKTTLLSQAIDENRLDPRGRDVWLSVDRADSSASVLADSILRAIGRVTEPHRIVTVDDICEAIWGETPDNICLVLDDAHHLVGTPSAELLATLVSRLPTNGHLVIAGRELPAVPRARLRSQQQAIGISETDLRFTVDESCEFAERRGVPAAVFDDTAGWPALAELRAAFGAPAHREFLWEEVLAPLTLDDRKAFLLIAAVGGGDAEIVAAAAGRQPDAELLSMLPLTVSDTQGGLRPHALWAEMARNVLDQQDLEACRRRVGAVLRSRGEYGFAFELLADAHDWDSALATLFEACNDQRRPPWPDVVARWKARVDPTLSERPEVTYLDAYLARCEDPWSDVAWSAFGCSIDAFRARGESSRAMTAEVRMLWSAWHNRWHVCAACSWDRSIGLAARAARRRRDRARHPRAGARWCRRRPARQRARVPGAAHAAGRACGGDGAAPAAARGARPTRARRTRRAAARGGAVRDLRQVRRLPPAAPRRPRSTRGEA